MRSWRWPLILTVIFLAIATFTLSPRLTQTQGAFTSINYNQSVIDATHSCPTAPPNPPLSPNTQGRFDWRAIQNHYPVTQLSALPSGGPSSKRPTVQHTFGTTPSTTGDDSISRKQVVKSVFERCWKSYKHRAWTKDELAPISGGSKDTFGGWGATLVDSLDTLWIMGMKNEFAEAVDAAIQINFGPNNFGEINMFEIIMRYLGGFLGAYDVSGCRDSRLLLQAMEVADMAYASFDTPNRMIVSRWSPQKAADGEEQVPHDSVLLAEAASASAEFTRLSQITGDMR